MAMERTALKFILQNNLDILNRDLSNTATWADVYRVVADARARKVKEALTSIVGGYNLADLSTALSIADAEMCAELAKLPAGREITYTWGSPTVAPSHIVSAWSTSTPAPVTCVSSEFPPLGIKPVPLLTRQQATNALAVAMDEMDNGDTATLDSAENQIEAAEKLRDRTRKAPAPKKRKK